jgi:hypothetical protein
VKSSRWCGSRLVIRHSAKARTARDHPTLDARPILHAHVARLVVDRADVPVARGDVPMGHLGVRRERDFLCVLPASERVTLTILHSGSHTWRTLPSQIPTTSSPSTHQARASASRPRPTASTGQITATHSTGRAGRSTTGGRVRARSGARPTTTRPAATSSTGRKIPALIRTSRSASRSTSYTGHPWTSTLTCAAGFSHSHAALCTLQYNSDCR